jgi:hypothetical protein
MLYGKGIVVASQLSAVVEACVSCTAELIIDNPNLHAINAEPKDRAYVATGQARQSSM